MDRIKICKSLDNERGEVSGFSGNIKGFLYGSCTPFDCQACEHEIHYETIPSAIDIAREELIQFYKSIDSRFYGDKERK